MVAYPDVLESRDFIEANVSKAYADRVRVGGCKLTIDGSPQGFTALRDRPYYDPVGDYPPGYAGYASVTMEQVQDAVDWCYERGIQINTHANGEGASDMLIAAIGAAQAKFGTSGIRPVLVHGQFQREDQINGYKRLGVFPSLFPMHTFYWGDWHRDHMVGPVNAENISPTGWVRQRDMMFGTHHDAPVAFPDSPETLIDLDVLAAIKEDKVIFEAKDRAREGRLDWRMFAANPDMAHEFLHAMYHGMGSQAHGHGSGQNTDRSPGGCPARDRTALLPCCVSISPDRCISPTGDREYRDP